MKIINVVKLLGLSMLGFTFTFAVFAAWVVNPLLLLVLFTFLALD